MQVFVICPLKTDDKLIHYSTRIYILLGKIPLLIALLKSPSSKYERYQACYRTRVPLVTSIFWALYHGFN